MKLPRDAGGWIELKEGTGPLTAMCPCGTFLEIYKEDVTFRLQTPETIDPARTNPHAPFVAAVTDTIGSSNPVVARVLLQGHEILESALLSQSIDKPSVIQHLHEAKEALVVCQKVAKRIEGHVDRISNEIRTGGIGGNRGRALNPFPQVPELEADVTMFLIHAKRTVQKVCRLPLLFLLVEHKDSNFDALLKTLLRAKCTTPLTDFIQNNAAGVRAIIDLRNYQEHPSSQKRTIIENFRVTASGEIAVPVWYVSREEPSSVRDDMLAIVDFLIRVSESMLIHLVMGTVEKGIPFVIQKIAEPDPKLPIKYRLSVDITKVRVIRKEPA